MSQFKLIIDGSSVRNHSIDVLKEALSNLNQEEGRFLVLEPKKPINNSIYLQVVYENNLFVAEIRFVFTPDNHKHYSYMFDDLEELYDIFSNYYLEEKIPDLKLWSDGAEVSGEVLEDEMVKLYSQKGDTINYFEVWLNDDGLSLTTHKGTVGETGETEEIIYDEDGDLPVDVEMERLVSDIKKRGYTDVFPLIEITIQYSYTERTDMELLAEKAQRIEALLNEYLGWTGNGHCDGHDIGSGELSIFCYVVSKDIASKTILEMLVEEGYLDGVKIYFADEQTEEYKLLYPFL